MINSPFIELNFLDLSNIIIRFDYLKKSSIISLNNYVDLITSLEFRLFFKNYFYSRPMIKNYKDKFEYSNNDRTLLLQFSDDKLENLTIKFNDEILLDIKNENI